MIIKSDLFIKLISWFMKPSAITLWPFIIVSPRRVLQQAVREKRSSVALYAHLINHEQIHLAQQRELYLIGFYTLYIYYFLKLYIKYRDTNKAYLKIPFEREAYSNQYDRDYLKWRPKKAWKDIKYFN